MPHATPTALDILTEARALIALPERWTQGAYARNKHGAAIAMRSRHAVAFCATAALYRAMDRHAHGTALPADLQQACKRARDILDGTVAELTEGRYTATHNYNDATSHSCMLHTFDIAISDAGGLPVGTAA